MPPARGAGYTGDMTFLWFVVWFICDRIGDREALRFDPLDWWSATLLLSIALDLGRQHTTPSRKT